MCSNIGKDEDMRPLLLQTGEVPSTAAEQAGAADQLGAGHWQEDGQGGDHDHDNGSDESVPMSRVEQTTPRLPLCGSMWSLLTTSRIQRQRGS